MANDRIIKRKHYELEIQTGKVSENQNKEKVSKKREIKKERKQLKFREKEINIRGQEKFVNKEQDEEQDEEQETAVFGKEFQSENLPIQASFPLLNC